MPCGTTRCCRTLTAKASAFPSARAGPPRQRHWLQNYFRSEVLPVLSPLGLDPAHPFPRILNKSLNIAVALRGTDAFGREGHIALVRAPRSLPRLVRLPAEVCTQPYEFVFLSSILLQFVDELFPGMRVKGAYPFRVTRNSELFVDEEEVEDLAHALRDELRGRGFARAVRLEISETCPKSVADFLMRNFELDETQVYRCNGPVNIHRVAAIYDQIERADLKFPRFTPHMPDALAAERNLFEAIAERDILLHHPFESFGAVLELVRQASADPNVLAIKQTLYRTGADSPMIGLLIDAARAGKDVTVVVELRARFDEEQNIAFANRLQEAGVQVVYGVVGYKTHAKMLLIVRREQGTLAPLRAPFHRQLPSPDLAPVHRLRPDDVEPGDRQRRARPVPADFRPRARAAAQAPAAIAVHPAQARAGDDRTRDRARARRQARAHRRQDECAQRSRSGRAAVQGIAGRRAHRPDRARRLHAAPRRARGFRTTSAYARSSAASSNTAACTGSPTAATPRSGAPAPTGWSATCCAAIEVCFPILDAELAQRVYDETLENYLADNTQAWLLCADGRYVRATPGDDMPHAAQAALLARLCP